MEIGRGFVVGDEHTVLCADYVLLIAHLKPA